MMRRKLTIGLTLCGLASLVTLCTWAVQVPTASAHCQVPCGIYDDQARFTAMREDATTISKAIAKINELAGAHNSLGMNQATRWVMTKEIHASHVITVVAEYFLTQKLKPVTKGDAAYDAYLASLADHHAVMRAAMKTKQTADPAAAEALSKAIDALAKRY